MKRSWSFMSCTEKEFKIEKKQTQTNKRNQRKKALLFMGKYYLLGVLRCK